MSETPFIKFADIGAVDIVDPDNIAPVYADMLTEVREVDGVIYLSLGSFIIDGDEGGRKVRVVTRIRMSRGRANVLYGLLGNMLAEAASPAKEAVN